MVEVAGSLSKHVECSESTQKARTRDASSQTNLRLPLTQHDIIWTATHLRPMIDEDEGDAARNESDTNSSREEIKEGSSVDAIDTLGEDEGSRLSMVPMASQETEQENARNEVNLDAAPKEPQFDLPLRVLRGRLTYRATRNLLGAYEPTKSLL
jgi:hypothetical protein